MIHLLALATRPPALRQAVRVTSLRSGVRASGGARRRSHPDPGHDARSPDPWRDDPSRPSGRPSSATSWCSAATSRSDRQGSRCPRSQRCDRRFTGKHLAPASIDTHSHMAIDGGVNEGTLSITAECDISARDRARRRLAYRALAGGVTTIQRPARLGQRDRRAQRGDQAALRSTRDELRFPARPGASSSRWARTPSAPTSARASATLRRASGRGVGLPARPGARGEYQREWRDYEERTRARGRRARRARDVRLEVLSGILDGDVQVHSHCYRADEILMLLRTAEDFGFRVADAAARAGGLQGRRTRSRATARAPRPSATGGATRQEAYDAIPQNAAPARRGRGSSPRSTRTATSSSATSISRRAKSGALRRSRSGARAALVTLNSAIQLGIQARVGSIRGRQGRGPRAARTPIRCRSTRASSGRWSTARSSSSGATPSDSTAEQRLSRLLPARAAVEASFDPRAGDLRGHRRRHTCIRSRARTSRRHAARPGRRIVDLGADVAVPAGAQVIDATGKHVLAGHDRARHRRSACARSGVGARDAGRRRDRRQPARPARGEPRSYADLGAHPSTRTNGITRVPDGRPGAADRSAASPR